MKSFHAICLGFIAGSLCVFLVLPVVDKITFSEDSQKNKIAVAGKGLILDTAKTEDKDTVSINLYQELMRLNDEYIEKLQTISAYEIKENPTADNLKKLGFTSAQNARQDDEKISEKRAAQDILSRIAYYENKYRKFKFITTDTTAEQVLLPQHGNVYGKIFTQLYRGYGMVIFDANEFQGAIPDSVIDKISAFDLSKIDKQDLVKYSIGRVLIRDNSEHNYERFETGFKVLAPRYMGENNKDPIILFPVNHGYLIIAHWEY